MCVRFFFLFGVSLIVSSISFGRDFSEVDFNMNNIQFIRQSVLLYKDSKRRSSYSFFILGCCCCCWVCYCAITRLWYPQVTVKLSHNRENEDVKKITHPLSTLINSQSQQIINKMTTSLHSQSQALSFSCNFQWHSRFIFCTVNRKCTLFYSENHFSWCLYWFSPWNFAHENRTIKNIAYI